ncbi:MAG: histidine kinase [Bacteroidetes bacterium]|nr:histidine kinase [Bacteroidota bacterium]
MQNAAFFLRYKLHHFFFWMLILGIWYFLRVDDYPTQQLAFEVTLIKVVDLALLIYITSFFLVPRLLYKKKYLLFALIFITMVFASSIFKMNILGQMQNNRGLINWSVDFKARLYDNILPHFFLVIAGVAVKLAFDYGHLQQRMAQIAKEKAETELNFLKSQINPHFVFNTLNAIYFLINKDNAEARGALHTFSDMLRYQLYEMNDEQIPIEKEIRYLKDFITLQQLRKDGRYDVQFTSTPAVRGFRIEPLLLIPFVENAFKHISHHTLRQNSVHTTMDMQGDQFIFYVENTRDAGSVKEGAGGIGLANVKRRLELLYPGKYVLDIKEGDGSFSITLKMKVHEH